jgi:hypothetical protein
MFEAAIGDQKPVLEKIFGKKGLLTIKDMAGNRPLFKEIPNNSGLSGMIEVRTGGVYKNRAFWLSPVYNWEIKTDGLDSLVLVPTPKN